MALTEQECSELLPWYVNGTLSADEKNAVEASLNNSEDLRDQLEKLKRLKQSLPERENFSGSELGWRRLQKQIRAEKSQINPANWKAYLAIAAVLVLSVQVAFFALKPSQTTDVQLLGGQAVLLQSDQLLLQVQLAPDASWQQVTDMFSTLNASIVQGPSALGLVYVQIDLREVILNDEPVTNAQQVLDWLSAQKLIVHVAIERAPAEHLSDESGE